MRRSRKIRVRGYKGDRAPKPTTFPDEDFSNRQIYQWDGNQPWSQKPMSALEEDYFEVLEELRPKLKGRQKQIIDLLLNGELNQAEMGRKIGIARKDVVIHLRRIANKIKKSVRGSVEK